MGPALFFEICPQSELRRQEEEAKKLRLQGQNPDAGKDDGDLMSVAKDWAGELISGQTGTGRILVRRNDNSNLYLF